MMSDDEAQHGGVGVSPVVFGLEEPDAARRMMASMGGRDQYHSDDEDDDATDYDDEDETLGERLLGLTEMLPESMRKISSNAMYWTWTSGKFLLNIGRVGLWVVASSATILALPVMFESERTQIEEQQLSQQRQLMLGPSAASMGSSGGMHSSAFPQVAPP